MWWDGITLRQIQKRNNRREKLYRVLKLMEDETSESSRESNGEKN